MATRRDFIAIADSLGLVIRFADTKDQKVGAWKAVHALIGPLTSLNRSFDKQRFLDHVQEVSEGTRGVTT